jgi:hypothetical protein
MKKKTALGMTAMNDYPSMNWLTRCRDRVKADPEVDVIGEWFAMSFLTYGDSRFTVKVEKGKIVDIVPRLWLDVRSIFGFASRSRSGENSLAPILHRCSAISLRCLKRVPDFTLKGDNLIAMQNAREAKASENSISSGS